MYKVIFIDDEAVTLNLLRSAIDWEKYSIVVSGTANDGEEGIVLFRQVEPDIVVADIRMPKMNGIEFADVIRQTNKKVKILFLSAYADFEYAQNAIKHQICEYLLKPLDEDKLEVAIARIVREIDRENAISDTIVNYRMEQAEEKLQQLLIQNRETRLSNEVVEIPKEILDTFVGTDILIDVLSAKETQNLKDYTYFEIIRQLFKDRLGPATSMIMISPVELIVLTTSSEFQLELGGILSTLHQHDKPVKIGISSINRPFELVQAYHQAESALSQCFYTGEELCIYSDNIYFSNDLTINLADFEQQITDLVEQGKSGDLIDVFQARLFDLFRKRVNPSLIYDFVFDVLTWIRIAILKHYRDAAINCLYSIDQNRLRVCTTKEALVMYLNLLLQTISKSIIEMLAEDSGYYVVKRAKDYTKDHYTQVDFSLQDVADYVGLSKNHFSRVFHEITGQKFWDYVTQHRVEKAKELLKKSNSSNYDISLAIGYASEFYFSKKFKMVVGLTPQQFRKL